MAYSKDKRETQKGFYAQMSKTVSDERIALLYTAICNDYYNKYGSYFIGTHDIRRSLPDPDYGSHRPHELIVIRQLDALYSKNIDFGKEEDKERAAWETFAESEIVCRDVNLRYHRTGSCLSTENSDYEAILFIARRKISSILRDIPKLADLTLSFGPGASAGMVDNNHEYNARMKLNAIPTISEDAISQLQGLFDELPMLASACKRTAEVSEGRLSFVPKNRKTHRSIMIEPLLNTMVQKAIGSYLKDQLLSCGINLRDQTINQRRAKMASITGLLATIDLSSASDRIASSILLDFFPNDWFDFLAVWRTSRVTYEKKSLSFPLEKFSSMGNGYTFEIESVIFYALTYAVCVYNDVKPDISIFGDDIICPSEIAEQLSDLFGSLGFQVNKSKSYSTGSFRESCGHDYYNGTNIRPFYVRKRLSSSILVSFLNFHLYKNLISDATRDLVMSWLPPVHKVFGPVGFGDGHIHDWNFSPLAHGRKHGLDLWTFKTFVRKNIRSKQVCRIGDELIPYYEVSLKPSIDPGIRDSSYLDSSLGFEGPVRNRNWNIPRNSFAIRKNEPSVNLLKELRMLTLKQLTYSGTTVCDPLVIRGEGDSRLSSIHFLRANLNVFLEPNVAHV